MPGVGNRKDQTSGGEVDTKSMFDILLLGSCACIILARAFTFAGKAKDRLPRGPVCRKWTTHQLCIPRSRESTLTNWEHKEASIWREKASKCDIPSIECCDDTQGAAGDVDLGISSELSSGQQDEGQRQEEEDADETDGGAHGSNEEDEGHDKPGDEVEAERVGQLGVVLVSVEDTGVGPLRGIIDDASALCAVRTEEDSLRRWQRRRTRRLRRT